MNHPIIDFFLQLNDRKEIYQHGGLLRFADTGKTHLGDYHVRNDTFRLDALSGAGFLRYALIPNHYPGEDFAIRLMPTTLTAGAILAYDNTNIDELLAQAAYAKDESYGIF